MGVALPSMTPTTSPPIEISTAQYVNLTGSTIVMPYEDYTTRSEYPYGHLISSDKVRRLSVVPGDMQDVLAFSTY